MAGFRCKNKFQAWKLRRRMRKDCRLKTKNGIAANESAGRRRALLGGVWVDKEGNLYNCLAQRIGKLISVEERKRLKDS